MNRCKNSLMTLLAGFSFGLIPSNVRLVDGGHLRIFNLEVGIGDLPAIITAVATALLFVVARIEYRMLMQKNMETQADAMTAWVGLSSTGNAAIFLRNRSKSEVTNVLAYTMINNESYLFGIRMEQLPVNGDHCVAIPEYLQSYVKKPIELTNRVVLEFTDSKSERWRRGETGQLRRLPSGVL